MNDDEWWMNNEAIPGEEIILTRDIEHEGVTYQAGYVLKIMDETEDRPDPVHDCGVNGILALVLLGGTERVLCEHDFKPTRL